MLIGLAAGLATLLVLHRSRLTDLRASVDAGANAAVLPVLVVAIFVGFGTVVADLPAFAAFQMPVDPSFGIRHSLQSGACPGGLAA